MNAPTRDAKGRFIRATNDNEPVYTHGPSTLPFWGVLACIIFVVGALYLAGH